MGKIEKSQYDLWRSGKLGLKFEKTSQKNIWTDFEEQKFITGETDQKIVNLLCPEVYI